jgi:hypothetical protein
MQHALMALAHTYVLVMQAILETARSAPTLMSVLRTGTIVMVMQLAQTQTDHSHVCVIWDILALVSLAWTLMNANTVLVTRMQLVQTLSVHTPVHANLHIPAMELTVMI